MRYRRILLPGGTFFFTIVTFQRRKILSSPFAIDLLKYAFLRVSQSYPIHWEACVVMPDHIHAIWTLPENDGDYPTRWRLIKSYFSHRFDTNQQEKIPSSRSNKGERIIWQRRYWEHMIRDERDLKRHVEYIHYNPVKHGLVKSPCEWKFSSFHRYVRDGLYPMDWAADPGEINSIGE